MELFTLIIINIITAVALYILFSVRFSLAVDKIVERTRKNAVLKDLRENVEATVEYINTSLDLMDQKNRAFYQLVRKSEELVKHLEAHGATGEVPPPAPEPAPADIEAEGAIGVLTEQELSILQAPLEETNESQREALVPRKSPAPVERPTQPDLPGQPEPRPEATRGTSLDRVLNAMGDDRLDISGGPGTVADVAREAEQSADVGRRFQPARRPERSEGLYPRNSGFTMEDVGLPSGGQAADREPGLVSLLEGAGRTVRRMLGMQAMGGPDGAGNTNREIDTPPPDRDWRSPPREVPEENPFEALLGDKLRRLEAEGASSVPLREDEPAQNITELQQERVAPRTAANPAEADDLEASEEIRLMREEVRAASAGGRREIILRLSERGYGTREIAALTGISKAEVDLVAALPVTPSRPRRTRRAPDAEHGA